MHGFCFTCVRFCFNKLQLLDCAHTVSSVLWDVVFAMIFQVMQVSMYGHSHQCDWSCNSAHVHKTQLVLLVFRIFGCHKGMAFIIYQENNEQSLYLLMWWTNAPVVALHYHQHSSKENEQMRKAVFHNLLVTISTASSKRAKTPKIAR